jgi:hypothetical protein
MIDSSGVAIDDPPTPNTPINAPIETPARTKRGQGATGERYTGAELAGTLALRRGRSGSVALADAPALELWHDLCMVNARRTRPTTDGARWR